jgi:recombination protein RecA
MKKTPVKKSTPKKKASPKKKAPTDPLKEFVSFISGPKEDMDILMLSDDELWSNVNGYVSTQSLAINKAISAPGLPLGRITEISGDEHTGKSTLLDHVFAEVQRIGGYAVLLDPEVGRDAKYTRSIGVDPEKLLCPQPKEGKFYTLQSVFNFCGRTCEWWHTHHPGVPVVIGVDSIAGMPTDEDMKRDASDAKPGDAAKTIRHSLRTLTQRVAQSNVALVFVNQLYDVIGPFGGQREYGGKGMRYHASLRIRLKRGRLSNDTPVLKDPTGRVFGGVTTAHVQKTKISGTTGARTEFAIMHGRGIDNVWTLFETFKKAGYIGSGGGWYSMVLPGSGETIKWNGGHFGLAEYLIDKPELYGQLVDIFMEIP